MRFLRSVLLLIVLLVSMSGCLTVYMDRTPGSYYGSYPIYRAPYPYYPPPYYPYYSFYSYSWYGGLGSGGHFHHHHHHH